MALNRYVTTAAVTIPAGTVSGGTAGSGSTPATSWAPLWPVTVPRGTPLVLDPAGKLFAAISGSLRAWVDGTDNVGHAGISN